MAAATNTPSAPQPLPKWQTITFPLIAGLLHLQVFYYAAVHCIFRAYFKSATVSVSSDEFRNECFLLDRAIFMAYVFDLLCCYFKVIPFSRCNCSRDIIGHHVPTLLMALPLAIPLWSGTNYLRQFEISFDILENTTNDEQLRTHFINSYTLASGFAYISSLNEVFMCFQRVEMSLAGVHSFREIPSMKRKRFFTSQVAVCIELCYKLCFFWGISILACKACCDFDKALYDSIIGSSTSTTTWRTLLTVYSSPAVLRGALFRVFSIVMYPSMGKRVLKKMKNLSRDMNSVKLEDVKRS